MASPWLDELAELAASFHSQQVQAVTLSASVAVTALWLLTRLGRFQTPHPHIDVRVSTTYQFVDMERDGIDLAIRYATQAQVPRDSLRLLEEQVVPIVSPALAQRIADDPAALKAQVLIEYDDKPRPWVGWGD